MLPRFSFGIAANTSALVRGGVGTYSLIPSPTYSPWNPGRPLARKCVASWANVMRSGSLAAVSAGSRQATSRRIAGNPAGGDQMAGTSSYSAAEAMEATMASTKARIMD